MGNEICVAGPVLECCPGDRYVYYPEVEGQDFPPDFLLHFPVSEDAESVDSLSSPWMSPPASPHSAVAWPAEKRTKMQYGPYDTDEHAEGEHWSFFMGGCWSFFGPSHKAEGEHAPEGVGHEPLLSDRSRLRAPWDTGLRPLEDSMDYSITTDLEEEWEAKMRFRGPPAAAPTH
uniref:Uncharacterized protein n=1 Tax=Fibrocapsa japonica TaxID=94617 RepID=A0A7S2V5F7_9STRA|mmetsp:Transcript_8029/g.12291  ORF Transcript_8029/g.12291 Transcript_8029/m.12291 type:complete len:174 (+) Transcript_8029:70-591(+)|eukprot:CAMPEP_0113934568 /NCGR_PEP_ID=MMETSP1339-20121228/1890_1 /TAXON_ID=94617 /ORGANISM="Fibrocapsa japonica" /LENGTH=173 /DNA_ID=CAMNT_0000936427 /DNA_START=70 /DNA_END=591 /DNA_ORIENTATION=- /assembly_acc=CAM_ASM_000762